MTLKQTRNYLISKGWQFDANSSNLLHWGHTFCLNLPEDASGLHEGEPESLRCNLAVKYASMAEERPSDQIAADIESFPDL